MPIEIKKLVIQAKVNASQASPTFSGKPGRQEEETEQIIEACVKAVLKILDKQKLR